MKIFPIKIHYKEIMIVFAILFFTIISSYVTISPYITNFVKHDRIFQFISVFIVSLSIILSFKSTIHIKFEYLFNALIITFIFGLITKPKPKLARKLKSLEDNLMIDYEKMKEKVIEKKNHTMNFDKYNFEE